MTTTMDVDRVEIPIARLLAPRPLTLVQQLVAAIENVESVLLDAYEDGRVEDPEIIMLQGMRDAFVLVLGQLSLVR
jgi:hypothetical protein